MNFLISGSSLCEVQLGLCVYCNERTISPNAEFVVFSWVAFVNVKEFNGPSLTFNVFNFYEVLAICSLTIFSFLSGLLFVFFFSKMCPSVYVKVVILFYGKVFGCCRNFIDSSRRLFFLELKVDKKSQWSFNLVSCKCGIMSFLEHVYCSWGMQPFIPKSDGKFSAVTVLSYAQFSFVSETSREWYTNLAELVTETIELS